MTFKRVVIAAAIALVASPCWAGSNDGPSDTKGKSETPAVTKARSSGLSKGDIQKPGQLLQDVDDPEKGDLLDGLVPRKPLSKKPTAQLAFPADATGRVIVKFTDAVKARAVNNRLTSARADLLQKNGQFAAANLEAQSMIAAEAIIAGHGLTISPAITGGAELIARVEQKAALYSGNAQPDLAGMVYLDGPEGALLAAGRQLNGLDVVEFVNFESEIRIAGGTEACCFPQTDECVDLAPEDCVAVFGLPQGEGTDCTSFNAGECPDTGQCCVGDTCLDLTEDDCNVIPDSQFRGVGTLCAEQDACGDLDCGIGEPCFQINSQGFPFCEDAACCQLVCTIAPFCCETVWDNNCAFLAQSLCETGDPCQTPLTGPCFEAHPLTGCNNSACCDAVCAVSAFCCDVVWDDSCVTLANDLCFDPGAGPTPDFASAQGYLKAGSYFAEEGGIPAAIIGSIPLNPITLMPFPGYGGEGYDLEAFETFVSAVDAQTQQDLSSMRGGGIRVAVIEHSAFVNHEDYDATPEPGQTILTIPGSANLTGDHGTACLGIIGARDDGLDYYDSEVGCVGVAPDVELWFFPIVSAEQGGRTIDAITNAIDRFDAGDIFSMSIGPGNGTLATNEPTWTILKVATDAGISAVMAAGNSSLNLDFSPQFDVDGGMTIVGAGFPGETHCRLGFSNHCEDCEVDAGIVDVQSWGTAVFSTGYGDAFFGDGNKNRSYTATFGGTSAACPMYVGTVARLQAFAKAFYGIPLPPSSIRGVSSGGKLQCRMATPPGAPDGQERFGDFDPDEAPNRIGNFPIMLGNAEVVISSNFFDGSDPLTDVFILRGIYVQGNDNSVRASDDLYLIVDSRYQDRPSGISHPDVPEAGRARYLAPGQTVDIAAVINSIESVDPSALTMTVELRFAPDFGILVAEIFDYNANAWRFVALESLTGDAAADQTFADLEATNAAGLVRNSDGRCIARVYTVALGAAQQYRSRIDLINVALDSIGPGGLPRVAGKKGR